MNSLGTLIWRNTGACKGKIRSFFLDRIDRLRFKDENVFVNLKCSFLFDLLTDVFTDNCVFHENRKTDKSQKCKKSY